MGEDATIEVRQTETMGRGVFAARPIAADEVLGTFHTIRLPPSEVDAHRAARATLLNYWFEDDSDGSALVVLGWLELVNHAHVPNCDRRWQATPVGDVVSVVALTDIGVGEQLFIDYRFDSAAVDTPAWALRVKSG